MGIVTTLRGIPFRVKLGELPLPLDVCAKHNLVQEAVFRQGPEAPGLKDVVLEVATRANDHLNTARQYIDEMKGKNNDLLKSAFCVFLPAVASILNLADNRFHQESIFLIWRRQTLIRSYDSQRIGSCRTACGRHNGKQNCKYIA